MTRCNTSRILLRGPWTFLWAFLALLATGIIGTPLVAQPLGNASQPFGANDLDAIYSDTASVRYRIDRACLANLDGCLATGGPSSRCATSKPLTGLACQSAVHRFCRQKGHVSGWGVENADDADQVEITCLTAAAGANFSPTHGQLQGFFGPCQDAQPGRQCSVAIDRYCNDQSGFATGFGPQERNASIATVACVKDSVAQRVSAPRAEIEAQVPGCNLGAATVSTACRQAMALQCQAEDASWWGGFGPAELGPTTTIGCVESRLPWLANTELPEAPTLPVDVLDRRLDLTSGQNGTAVKYQSTRVHTSLVSNRSLSFDGRLRVVGVGGALSFRVHTPEIFDRPISQPQTAGRNRSYEQGSWASLYGFEVAGEAFHDSTDGGQLEGKSSAICDPHQGDGDFPQLNRQQSVPGRQSNPFACNSAGDTSAPGDHDCYDVTLVTVYDTGPQDELWGTPIRVVVANPKGAGVNGVNSLATRAQVVNVLILGDPQKAPFPTGEPTDILEPNITGDGRLIVIQGDGMIRYAVMPKSATPCDVTAWTSFPHLYEMHDDPLMADYGVARFPLRDFENRILSPQAPGDHRIRAGYPWIDRDGDNLMFMLGQSGLFYMDENEVARAKFEVVGHPFYGTQPTIPCDATCSGSLPLSPSTRQEVESLTDHLPRVGLTLMGLWTQGKLFRPDSRNNNVDAVVPTGTPFHRLLRLYEDRPGGTEVGPSARTLINSLENQFAFDPDLRPDLPREVVWQLSSQGQTDEVTFDDVIDPAALIVASMGTTIDATRTHAGRFQDGFVYTGRIDGEGFQHPAHLANEAAATEWNLPAYGYLLGGARAEPIAAGGYRGKGLWLDGTNDRLEFLIDEQPRVVREGYDPPWFYTLSLDPRDLTGRQRLLTWPDGTWLDLVDSRTLRFAVGNGATTDLSIPAALALTEGTWSSLAVTSRPAGFGGVEIDFDLDGYRLQTVVLAQPAFRLPPGRLVVGAETGGFRGWIDDFKVIARAPGPEVICNHARGTLVGVETDDPLFYRADAYPAASHNAISLQLPPEHFFARYACERPIAHPVDVTDAADHSHYQCLGQTRRLENHPQPNKCLRPALLFPEGPLHFDGPRPSSVANSFCLSCHTDQSPSQTLDVTHALAGGTVDAPLDVRRQPLQNSPRFFGNIPALFFGAWPLTLFQTPVQGVLLDFYLLPPSSP